MVGRYVSIDIETTGLDPITHNVLEFGAVIDDLNFQDDLDSLPTFHCYVLPPTMDGYVGDAYALHLNAEILGKISRRLSSKNRDLFLRPQEVAPTFIKWCISHGLVSSRDSKKAKFVAAGKNVSGFDLPFLRSQLAGFGDISIGHRVLDPAILYYDPTVDTAPPDIKTCLQRAGINDDVPHLAVEDAKLVIRLLRNKFPLTGL